MLSLRGIPLSTAEDFRRSDAESATYAASQRAFDALRGPGTPLLDARVVAEVKGPAPYVRVALKNMLSRLADGEDPTPVGEDEIRAAAEAHLALIEVLAARVAQPDPPADAASLPEAAESTAFGLKLSERPDWLQETVLKSLVRGETASSSQVMDGPPAPSPREDPVLRLSSESAYWRGIPPHGGVERRTAESRAASMAAVASASAMSVPEWQPTTVSRSRPGDDWERTARAQMAGAVDGPVGVPPRPGDDALRLAALRRLAAVEEPEVASPPAAIVTAGNIAKFLSTFDVMRNYVFQPV